MNGLLGYQSSNIRESISPILTFQRNTQLASFTPNSVGASPSTRYRAPSVQLFQENSARESLNVSQSVFARMLNVPTVTAASWEKGRRKPSGAALGLLQIARKHPETLLEG